MTFKEISSIYSYTLPFKDKPSATENNVVPFLKWAGGKKQLLIELVHYVPRKYDRYIEPFVGGGALFFSLQPSSAILGDLNEDLINTYIVVRDNVQSLIKELRKYINKEEFYYEIRALDPRNLSDIERAAKLILKQNLLNGSYRLNEKV